MPKIFFLCQFLPARLLGWQGECKTTLAVGEALHPPIPSLFFPGSRSGRHHVCSFHFNSVVELGRGVFGFSHVLQPPGPPCAA